MCSGEELQMQILLLVVVAGGVCVFVESLCGPSHLHRAGGSVSILTFQWMRETATLVSEPSGLAAVGYFSYV